jgi:hypothetical protein
MQSEEFGFMLWVQDPNGAWKLWRRSRQRQEIEDEAVRLPRSINWRFLSLYEGVLADSFVRA